MSNDNAENIVLKFGPAGQYELHVPIKDVDSVDITGRSFIEAGMALVLYARRDQPDPPSDMQKLFDWMLNFDEKAA